MSSTALTRFRPVAGMTLATRVCVVAACSWLTAAAAHAQTDSYISVGGDFGVDVPVSDELQTTQAFGVAFRLPRPDGWSAAWDFGSVSADLERTVGSAAADLGSLSVRPLLGGVAYTWRSGRFEATTAFTAGVSFVGLDVSDAAREELRRAFGAGDVDADGEVTLALMPKVTFWWDLNRWFALNAVAGYLRTRADITLSMPSGVVDRFPVNGDRMRLSVGVVVKAY